MIGDSPSEGNTMRRTFQAMSYLSIDDLSGVHAKQEGVNVV